MNKIKKIIIYYFSGTGNSKTVAKWLSDYSRDINIDFQIINIAEIDRKNIPKPETEVVIAFISPIHGFNYPPIMVNFLFNFPKGHNQILLMNTRAGMLIGKFITPGISGIAFYLASIVLIFKGYNIKAMYPVDLPSNWISIHPCLNEKTVKYLHDKNKERVNSFSQKIFSGRSVYKGLYEIIQDILVIPLSLGYYFFGRFFFAKTFFASGDCTNCSICIKSCAVKAIKKVNDKPFWSFSCESCMRCMSNCPKRAIETAHGFIVFFCLVYYKIIISFFNKYFSLCVFENHYFLKLIFENLLLLCLLGLGYRICFYFMRYNSFKKIIVYTSLTKYKFWGNRYKSIDN